MTISVSADQSDPINGQPDTAHAALQSAFYHHLPLVRSTCCKKCYSIVSQWWDPPVFVACDHECAIDHRTSLHNERGILYLRSKQTSASSRTKPLEPNAVCITPEITQTRIRYTQIALFLLGYWRHLNFTREQSKMQQGLRLSGYSNLTLLGAFCFSLCCIAWSHSSMHS
jgi:hypothetical protein